METTTKYKWLLIVVAALLVIALAVNAGVLVWIVRIKSEQVPVAVSAPAAAVASTDKTVAELKLRLADMEQDNRLLKEELKNVQKSACARIADLSDDGVAARLNMQLRRYREERSASTDNVE